MDNAIILSAITAVALMIVFYGFMFNTDSRAGWTISGTGKPHQWQWTVTGKTGQVIEGCAKSSWVAKRQVARFTRIMATIEYQQRKQGDE